MKYSWFNSAAIPPLTLVGVTAACLLVLLAGCSPAVKIHHDETSPLEWDIDSASMPAEVTEPLSGVVIDEEMPAPIVVAVNDNTPTAFESAEPVKTVEPTETKVKVATIKPPKRRTNNAKSRRSSKERPRSMMEITPSACAEPFKGQDETISLATTAALKLRQGPSTSAATISVFNEGAMLTARKLTCGNWTEVVDGKRTIGYVHSYFLTSP